MYHQKVELIFLSTGGVRISTREIQWTGIHHVRWPFVVYLFCEALSPLGLARGVREPRSRFRSCQVLSIPIPSPVATDDKDNAASQPRGIGRATKREGRQREEEQEERTFYPSFASSVSPYRWRYRAPRRSSISPCSLHPSPLFSHPVPTAACASCSMARKITEPSIVFSLSPCPTGGIFAGGQYAGNSGARTLLFSGWKAPKGKKVNIK